MEFNHKPVMLYEAVESLNIKPGGIYVDATAGGGGHSFEIARRLHEAEPSLAADTSDKSDAADSLDKKNVHTGKLICLDRDPDAVQAARKRLELFSNVTVVNINYSQIDKAVKQLNIDKVDGVLMDLGVSSFQLDEAERGFSYHADAPLDMRMDKQGKSAADIVNNCNEQEIADMLYKYADEKYGRRIASAIVKARQEMKIETTGQLSNIISSAVPAAYRKNHHPARKTFQAIRMAVNEELYHLETGLAKAFELLKSGGRLSVITFHSIEDRIVKQYFASLCQGCTCPKDFPVCVCKNTPKGRLLYKKPVIPTKEETESNNRSRSAKLRTIIKL
ncbi:MAG TPA: 16S rRNA (cytosine(1402)-N(4))-methyltransferase RsmH [Firmicutes bacterium]|nr:16S rRNA (cytosine(1402)-N(4))-methyltransferase RsmH [Bacillota bacterium]